VILLISIVLPPALREVQSNIAFTSGPIFQLFAPQRRHFKPVEVKFGMANRTLDKPKQTARQKIRLRNTPEHFPERSLDWSSILNGLIFPIKKI